MKFSLFILFLMITLSAQADQSANHLARYIGKLNMYDVTFTLLDSKCSTSYSLTKKQVEEIDKLTLEKTGVSYKKYTSIVGDPELTLEMAEEAIQPLLDNNCNARLLDHWHYRVSKGVDKNLSELRNAEPTSMQIK
ncbi:hypothetical protein [Pseudoalteromonas luteoviolacea]|nr:hypothetical protein [Pseudoalteromonas luteoviolacea]